MSVEQRLAALEAEVQQLRQDLTDTHMLAAHADRDVAEFRGELRQQTQLINLTRQDVSGLGEVLRDVAALLKRQDERLERMERKLDGS